MGRYTTVQAFKDTDTRVPALSYEKATGKVADPETGELVDKKPLTKEDKYDEHGRRKGLTEKVLNPYGSTAGAGSGEFHTYRHGRDRENRRIERNLAKKKHEEITLTFQQKVARDKLEAEQRTAKKRAERKRKKQAKKLAKIRKDLNSKAGVTEHGEDNTTGASSPKAAASASNDSEADVDGGQAKRPKIATFEPPRNKNAIPNDGSFLETFGKIA